MYLLKRLLQTILVLAALSALLFYLFHLMPGRAEDQILAQNPDLSRAEVDRIRALRGLDRPVSARYACWVIGRRNSACTWWPSRGLLRGDLGHSSIHHVPVAQVLAQRTPNTLRLMLPAMLLALLLTVPLGVLAATRSGRTADHLVTAFTFVGVCSPMHWLALLFIFVFALELPWLPAGGIAGVGDESLGSYVHHAVLPVLVAAVFFAGRWTRYLRAAIRETLGADFLDTARAKGLSEGRVVWVHALRYALLPLITVVTQSLPALFSGTLVLERVFTYPGVGLLIFESIEGDDHLVAVVVVLIAAAATMLAMLLGDVAYWIADPRTRRSA